MKRTIISLVPICLFLLTANVTYSFAQNNDKTYDDIYAIKVQSTCKSLPSTPCAGYPYYRVISNAKNESEFIQMCEKSSCERICDYKCATNLHCSIKDMNKYNICFSECNNTLCYAYHNTSMYKLSQEQAKQQLKEQIRIRQAQEQAEKNRLSGSQKSAQQLSTLKQGNSITIKEPGAKGPFLDVFIFFDFEENNKFFPYYNNFSGTYYKDNVRFILKNFPKQKHKGGAFAAEIVYSALEQKSLTGGPHPNNEASKQYDTNIMFNTIYDRLSNVYPCDIQHFFDAIFNSRTYGPVPDMDRLKNDLKNHAHKAQIDAEIKEALAIGLNENSKLPAYVIDGKLIEGYITPDDLKKKIDNFIQTRKEIEKKSEFNDVLKNW